MAKVVIYLFTYFCNIECSKILYGFGINTETADTHLSFLLPFLLQLGCRESGHPYIYHPTSLPPKAVYSGGVLNIKPETASRTSRLAAKSPVKTPDSIYL